METIIEENENTFMMPAIIENDFPHEGMVANAIITIKTIFPNSENIVLLPYLKCDDRYSRFFLIPKYTFNNINGFIYGPLYNIIDSKFIKL